MKSIILIVVVLLVFSCNETEKEPIQQKNTRTHMLAQKKALPRINHLYTTVEDLRVREAPSLQSQVLTTLPKNTELVYLNERSQHTEKITLRSITYHSPWYKVRLEERDLVGWVYGGAVSKEKMYYDEKCEGEEIEAVRLELKNILKRADLSGKYRVRCIGYYDYSIEGDFNGDGKEDIAILIESDILDGNNDYLTGILIATKDSLDSELIIFGVGLKDGIQGAEADFEMDDYTWVGIFETVSKGDTLEPNWNTETEDWYEEDDIIPEEKKVYLTNDAMFVHQEGSCGGGYIYWKDGMFHWMNLDG